jgi:hypothetical protein
MTKQHIVITKRQAIEIAKLLTKAPESALFTIEQTQDRKGGTHLYLHDRTLSDPSVHISRYGSVSPRLNDPSESVAVTSWE